MAGAIEDYVTGYTASDKIAQVEAKTAIDQQNVAKGQRELDAMKELDALSKPTTPTTPSPLGETKQPSSIDDTAKPVDHTKDYTDLISANKDVTSLSEQIKKQEEAVRIANRIPSEHEAQQKQLTILQSKLKDAQARQKKVSDSKLGALVSAGTTLIDNDGVNYPFFRQNMIDNIVAYETANNPGDKETQIAARMAAEAEFPTDWKDPKAKAAVQHNMTRFLDVAETLKLRESDTKTKALEENARYHNLQASINQVKLDQAVSSGDSKANTEAINQQNRLYDSASRALNQWTQDERDRVTLNYESALKNKDSQYFRFDEGDAKAVTDFTLAETEYKNMNKEIANARKIQESATKQLKLLGAIVDIRPSNEEVPPPKATDSRPPHVPEGAVFSKKTGLWYTRDGKSYNP